MSSRVALGAAVLSVVLTGCAASTLTGPAPAPAPAPAPEVWDTPVATSTDVPRGAVAVLDTLAVKGRAPMTGYDRAAFGPDWLDADRNGCDTRNDMLRRHLRDRRHDPAPRGCVVVSGVLNDPYTGARIRFVLGDGFAVDIDHVVALGNAWTTGAAYWDVAKRAAFANDPLNLLPVDAGANRQKGDADAATWLPPDKGYRCRYVARQVAVKSRYGLWVTAAEAAAIRRVLDGCGQLRLPEEPGAPLPVPVDPDAPVGGPGSGVSFDTCAAAVAAGAAPVRRGDPGYGAHLDRDGDGRGCE